MSESPAPTPILTLGTLCLRHQSPEDDQHAERFQILGGGAAPGEIRFHGIEAEVAQNIRVLVEDERLAHGFGQCAGRVF